MNLEYILTYKHKFEMMMWVQSKPEVFNELIELATIDKLPYSWRAAWLLWSCMDENDTRIQPFIEQMISVFDYLKNNQKRELLKVFQKMELNPDQEFTLFNLCIPIWKNIKLQPSIRYNALLYLFKCVNSQKYLLPELMFVLTDEYLNSLSKGIRHSVSLYLKKHNNSQY